MGCMFMDASENRSTFFTNITTHFWVVFFVSPVDKKNRTQYNKLVLRNNTIL